MSYGNNLLQARELTTSEEKREVLRILEQDARDTLKAAGASTLTEIEFFFNHPHKDGLMSYWRSK